MISIMTKPIKSNSEEKTNAAKRRNSKDSTFYKSGTTGLPLLLSSFYNNYRDKTLSLARKKRSVFNNTKSVFKFKETEKLLGKLKICTGNIELGAIKDKTYKLAEEVSAVNTQNVNLVKKLNLIKYISKTRSSNQLIPCHNNYLQDCVKLNQSNQLKKEKLVQKLNEIKAKIAEKQELNKKLDSELKSNKNIYVQLRAKRDINDTLKKKAIICERKSDSMRKLLEGDREVAFAAHNLILQNEKVQLEKLKLKIAEYIIENPAYQNKNSMRRLIFEAKALKMKKCSL